MARLLHDHIHVELIYKWNREQPTQKQSTCVYEVVLMNICLPFMQITNNYISVSSDPSYTFFCRSFMVLLFKHSVDTHNKRLLLINFCLCDCQ